MLDLSGDAGGVFVPGGVDDKSTMAGMDAVIALDVIDTDGVACSVGGEDDVLADGDVEKVRGFR